MRRGAGRLPRVGLGEAELIAFAATADPARARAFYADVLGLRLVADEPFALVFAAGAAMLRIQKVERVTALPYTAIGWRVPDIRAAMEELGERGVRFERFPGLSQDDAGVWHAPGGDRVAWFKDPDGTTLSLTQFAVGSRGPARPAPGRG